MSGIMDKLALKIHFHWAAYDDWCLADVIDKVYDRLFSIAVENHPDLWSGACRSARAGEPPTSSPGFWVRFTAETREPVGINRVRASSSVVPQKDDITTVGDETFDLAPEALDYLRHISFRSAVEHVIGAMHFGTILLIGKLDTSAGRPLDAHLLPGSLLENNRWIYERRESRLTASERNHAGEFDGFTDVRVRSAKAVKDAGVVLKEFAKLSEPPSHVEPTSSPARIMAPSTGRPADVRNRIMSQMRIAIQDGVLTPEKLAKMQQKEMIGNYGGGVSTVSYARDAVLQEYGITREKHSRGK
jgi:hypothetical protein